jgi:hypothetical protein
MDEPKSAGERLTEWLTQDGDGYGMTVLIVESARITDRLPICALCCRASKQFGRQQLGRRRGGGIFAGREALVPTESQASRSRTNEIVGEGLDISRGTYQR